MIKTELLEILINGENSVVEFKKDTIENYKMAKELVAFANFQGGKVLLGVENDGTISGISRDNLEEWVMTTCRDKIRPEIIPYFEIIRNVENDKDVAVVRVERGWTVHHVWHNHHRTYYIRVGTQSREAGPEELERLFQQRGAFRVELRGISGTSVDNLDKRRLIDYFQRIRQQSTPGPEDINAWETLLINTEFLVDEGETKPVSIAGMLLFGKNPNRFLPQAGIDAVSYPGQEKDYSAQERATLRGPMIPLFGSDGLIENGLVEQAFEFVKRNTKVDAFLENETRRVEKWSYPDEAVREAIVNALVHRDYLLSGTDIELSIYENRLEIISPGRLPNGITPPRMLSGCRSSRNQLLKDVMRDYGYLEHMGMGIPRKIVKSMREHNETSPDLAEFDERFMIRLWKVKPTVNI